MATLSRAALKRIFNYFDQSLLSQDLFDIEINKNDNIIEITYKDNSDFKLTITSNKDNNKIISYESPGYTLLEKEIIEIRNPPEIESRIRDWIKRIEAEIIIDHKNNDFYHKLSQKFDELVNTIDNPEEPFTTNEAADWEQKFDEVISKIEELKDEYRLQEHEISQLKQEIENMKTVSSKMPRKVWIKSVGGKILKWMDSKLDRAMDKAIETSIIAILSPPRDK